MQAAAARFGAALQDVSITSCDGARLQGWFSRRSHTNGDTIILLHGVGDNRQGMIGFAETYLARGYAVLMPDSRGHGESGGLPTYGIREVEDVSQWYEWLRIRYRPCCVFGMGQSMGAAILLQAAGRVPFCAIVAESPFASFRKIAFIRVGQFCGTGTWMGRTLLRPAVELAFLYGRLAHGIWLSDVSPEMSVAAIRVPVLLIHGLADANIPVQQSEMIFAQNPAAIRFWKVPNAGHCDARSADAHEYDERVVGWFASHRFKSH